MGLCKAMRTAFVQATMKGWRGCRGRVLVSIMKYIFCVVTLNQHYTNQDQLFYSVFLTMLQPHLWYMCLIWNRNLNTAWLFHIVFREIVMSYFALVCFNRINSFLSVRVTYLPTSFRLLLQTYDWRRSVHRITTESKTWAIFLESTVQQGSHNYPKDICV